MNLISDFILGPYGKAYSVIKREGRLFDESSFCVLPPALLDRYNQLSGGVHDILFCIQVDDKEKTISVVTAKEKDALMVASKHIRDIVSKIRSEVSSDKDIIEAFSSEFGFMADIRVEPAIY